MNTCSSESMLSQQARASFLEREGRPLFQANWEPAVFVHFEIPPSVLQPFVPLPLDRFDGKAFVSLVAFSFSHCRATRLGRVSELLLRPVVDSRFLNVRTYVRGPEGPGIFFLDEYLSNPLTVPLGPPLYGLPYHHGRIRFRFDPDLRFFQADIVGKNLRLSLHGNRQDAKWETCGSGTKEEFLLERYVAYTFHRGRTGFFRIWHQPWHHAECHLEEVPALKGMLAPWGAAAQFAFATVSPGTRNVWLGRPRTLPRSSRPRKQLTADVVIRSGSDLVWKRSQTPEEHQRWDIRFTGISYHEKSPSNLSQTFTYRTGIGSILQIQGWGKSRPLPDKQGSALRFGSDDPKSLIRNGSGSWRYEAHPEGTRFRTTYNYTTRFGAVGRVIDRILFRPLMQWGTRWSFDRLRLWIEREISPEVSLRLWMLKLTARWTLGLAWILNGLVPKILFVHPDEVRIVERSGLFWQTPELTLLLLGYAQIAAGFLLLTGWKERHGAVLSSLAILLLSLLVWRHDPMAFADPYGGLIKNLGLVLCALVVWMLEPLTPKAKRAAGATFASKIS